MSGSTDVERWRRRIVPAVLLAIAAWFYLWTVTQGWLPIPFGTSEPFYPALTDAFLAGQLHLQIEPHRDLLRMADPYANFHERAPFLHDASLYNGKYYAYFGATPVLLLFMPFRLLGLGNLPESAAAATFMFASLLCSLLTLSSLRRTAFPQLRHVPYRIYFLLAFGGAIPFFLRRPAVYEVAIACGSFCVAAAVYCLVSLESSGRVSLWKAGAASLFLGLAVGARPHLLMASVLLVFVGWRVWRRDAMSSVNVLVALLAPIALVGVALALYNYVRFDSFTEFGRFYQLAGENIREKTFDVSRIPVLAYYYLLHPGTVNLAFPFTHLQRLEYTIGGDVVVEPALGAFYTTPILYVLALLPLLRRISTAPGSAARAEPALVSAHGWAWVLVTLALAQVLFLATFPGATMRYIVDFAPLLMTAAGLVLMGVEVRLAASGWRRPVIALTGLLVGLTVFMNIGVGVTGYYDNLRGANPAAYESLKSSSERVVDALVPWVFDRDLQLLVIEPRGRAEQLVGVPSFWVAETESMVEVFARRGGFMVLQATVSIEPAFKSFERLPLEVRSGQGLEQSLSTGPGDITLVLPVRRGHNRFFFRTTGVPPSPGPEKPHVLLVKGREWRLSATAP